MAQLRLEAQYYGPNPLSSRPAILASVQPGEIDWQVESQKTSAVRSEFGLSALPGELSPAEAVLSTVVDIARKILNNPRGYVEDRGYRLQPVPVLWIEFHDGRVAWDGLRLAWQLVTSSESERKAAPITRTLSRLSAGCRMLHPDDHARVLIKSARAYDIPILQFAAHERIWQFGWGENSDLFFETSSNGDGSVAQRIARFKVTTSAALAGLGLPVPVNQLIATDADVQRALKAIGFPCVVKPQDRGGGRGVAANILTENEFLLAVKAAKAETTLPVMVEKKVEGTDYRILVIDGQSRWVIERRPPEVVGDGTSTVAELIEAFNLQRSGDMAREMYLKPVVPNDLVIQRLSAQGADMQTRPASGQTLQLRSNANRSSGGTCYDRTALAHPRVMELCERIAKTLGIRCCGVDVVTPDISKPLEKGNGAVIEINLTPGMGAVIATGAKDVEVGRAVLGARPGRIPVAMAIVQDADQARLAELLMTQLSMSGLRIALESKLLDKGGALEPGVQRPWETVRMALKDRTSKALVVIANSSDLKNRGLPVDRVDILVSGTTTFSADWDACLNRHVSSWRQAGRVEKMADIFAQRFQQSKSRPGGYQRSN